MIKAQIIAELHSNGEFWANESYSKITLEKYLNGVREARSMTMEQLLAKIKERKGA